MRPAPFYGVAIVVLVADQLTKRAVFGADLPAGGVPVLGKALSITPTSNAGGAFGLFHAAPAVFVALASVAAVALLLAYHRSHRRDGLMSLAIALALGGAVGNVIDRAFLGYVRDFFDVHVWPVFNVADSAITVAVALLLVRTLGEELRARRRPPADADVAA